MTNQEIIDNMKVKYDWLNNLEPDKINVIIEMLIMAYGEGYEDGWDKGSDEGHVAC